MLITAGGAELMRCDIERFAQRAVEQGVACELAVHEGMPHAHLMLGVPCLRRLSARVPEYVAKVLLHAAAQGAASTPSAA